MWPTNLRVVRPVLRSQRRRVLSHDDESANWPSDEMTTSETKWLWPWRIFLGKPNDDSSRESCQTMMVLSAGQPCSRAKFSPAKSGPLTTRRGEDHVRVLGRGGDGGDPARVAGKRTLERERLAHFDLFFGGGGK